MIEQHFDHYILRGQFKNINRFKTNPVLKYAMEDNELDVKPRGNQIHVYYNGGKAVEINPTSFSFDEKYFPESEREEVRNMCKSLVNASNEDIVRYFEHVKASMDSWIKDNSKIERLHQHHISTSNKVFSDNHDLVVVDIEFAVSFNSHCYNRAYYNELRVNNGGEAYKRYPNPRFDIVAVDKCGQVYVFELKTGLDAIENMQKHIADFNNFIGSTEVGDNPSCKKTRYEAFLDEMKCIVEGGIELGCIADDVKVDTTKVPIFSFAFTDRDDDNSYEEFKEEVIKASSAEACNSVFIDKNNGYILTKP